MTSVEKSLALGFILEIYRYHSAGCCWHIVLDDGNCEQGNVDFCRGVASKEQHMACMLLGGILADKTRGEVRAIVDKAHRKMSQART